MSRVAPGLPFTGTTPTSRHASHLGAVDAASRSRNQSAQYLELLRAAFPDGLTDREAADRLRLERSTINARRAPLVAAGLVEPRGYRAGPTGVRNTVWRLHE